jgi:replicative DNA helicase
MPHSVEAEEYLLSCCLIDGADVVARCLEARITPESFYVPAHGIIYEKLQDLYRPPGAHRRGGSRRGA